MRATLEWRGVLKVKRASGAFEADKAMRATLEWRGVLKVKRAGGAFEADKALRAMLEWPAPAHWHQDTRAGPSAFALAHPTASSVTLR
jgi:hypothetical protein